MKATKVNAGLAESNGRLLLGIWRDSLHVTGGLTACTPGSAPGPTLGDEYGKTLPLPYCEQCKKKKTSRVEIRDGLFSSSRPTRVFDTDRTVLSCLDSGAAGDAL